MDSFTGNKDVDYEILLLFTDVELEQFCQSSKSIHYLCDKIWYRKILHLYPTFPHLNLTIDEYRALYYKLRDQKWTDLVVYFEDNIEFNIWLLEQKDYTNFFVKSVNIYINTIPIVSYKEKIQLIQELYTFLYNHYLWIKNHPKFHQEVINKLNNFIIDAPENQELYELYIKLFNI